MLNVVLWSVIFSLVTAASIVLLGSRDFIDGPMTPFRMVHIIFDWRFIVGAILAFGARLLFVMTNNAIAKIPYLTDSSTTITALVNLSAILVIVFANYFFLHERLSTLQVLGAILVFTGVFLVTRA